MFGDLDWPLNASRGFVGISWASCLAYETKFIVRKWQWSSLQGRGEVDGVGIRHLGESWAAPRILRWGYKTGFASGASEKKIVPNFSKCGVTSKQISVGAYWIYWNLLSGCRINKHRSKDHFHWTAPCTLCTPLVPKVGDIVPTHPRLRRP